MFVPGLRVANWKAINEVRMIFVSVDANFVDSFLFRAKTLLQLLS